MFEEFTECSFHWFVISFPGRNGFQRLEQVFRHNPVTLPASAPKQLRDLFFQSTHG